MDFSNPMFLATAMIFHENMMSQTEFNNSLNQYSIPPIQYDECSYPVPSPNNFYYSNKHQIEPIEDTIKSPLYLENLSNGTVYFKAVLGLSNDSKTLFVSTLFNSPKLSQIASIVAVLKDKISGVKDDNIGLIYIIVSGIFTDEVKSEFIKNMNGDVIDIENSFIIKIES